MTVSLYQAAATAFSVDFATADGSASSGSDYQSKAGTLTFNPGDTTQTIEITLVNSDLIEADESIFVNLLNLQAVGMDLNIADAQGVVTIEDDDRASLSVQDLTVDEDTGTFLLTVSLDKPLLTSITVDFETLDGTALAGSDFSTTSGTLTFDPGETTQTISLTILDDSLLESTESFFVILSSLQQNGSPVDLVNDQAEITIQDNDQAILSINDIEVDEDSGTASLKVTLSRSLSTAFTVDYQTSDDSAVKDSDYLLSSGTLTFNAGELIKTIDVSIVDTDTVELTEILQVLLTNLQGTENYVILSDSVGEISILDDDQATLSIDDLAVSEDDGTAQLTVSLDQAVDGVVQVEFVTADQTAVTGTDFLQTDDTLIFNPGETTKTITVNLIDDDLLEIDETFLVNLLNLQAHGLAVSLNDPQAEVTIHDDDEATLSIDDLTVNEDAGTVNLTVSLDHPVPSAITFDFETLNGTAFSGDDYNATSGTLTFNPGETTQTITLEILNDDLNEAAESFFVNLTNLQAGGYQVNLVDPQSEITIISDEYSSLTINNVTVSEDSGLATLTVSLDQPLDSSFSVNYATADYLSNSIFHYESTSGTLTFNPGEQTQFISVPITDSDWVERDRIFVVDLSDIQSTGNRIELAKSRGLVTITEDDQAAFSVDDVIVDEDAGYATVTISLSTAVKTDINLYFNTTDQTAVSAQDYENRSGGMLIPFNARTHTYHIPIIDSDQVENDETFLFNLTEINANGLNVVIADDQGQITIRDNDQASITVQDLSVNEAADKALLTVSLDKPIDAPVSFDYSTLDQSATASSDYLAKSGTLTFTPGLIQQTIEIDLVNGIPVEPIETFDIQLSNLQAGGRNVIFTDDLATVTIVDDDLTVYDWDSKLYAVGTQNINDQFGYSVATDGNTLISTSLFWNASYPSQGAAFVYVRNNQGTPDDTSDDTWDYQDILLAPDADNGPTDRFGWSVDISGDTAVVGAILGDGTVEDMGSVYVYTRSNGNWSFQQELNVEETSESHFFGDVVKIEGDTIVVGARATENYTGSAYVFQRTDGVWTEAAKLMADDPAETANFGSAIDIENSTIVIGARFDSESLTRSGAVYIFEEQAGAWTQTQKIKDDSTAYLGTFGTSVSLSGDLLLVGAISTSDRVESTGKAILYQRDPGSGNWNSIQTLTASDSILNSYFGISVEIHDQQILVGNGKDPTGVGFNNAVYLFELEDQTWVEQQKISSPDAEYGDQFGRNFAITADTLFISAQYDNDKATSAGSIYVYNLAQKPAITIEDVSVTEEDDGSRLITANVTRTATQPGELLYEASVDFQTLDGTARVAAGDYESTTGTLIFESDPDASSQTKTISIRIFGDALPEIDETFGVELLNVAGHAQISDPDATITIQNDDQSTLTINDISVNEDAGFAEVTISLTQPLETPLSIDYTTSDQTAESATDYTSTSGTLTFNPGDISQTIFIPIIDSDMVELDETFFVNLSNLQTSDSNVILGSSQAQVTIVNDDQATLSINDVTVNEDAGTATLTVSLNQIVDTAISVDFTTVDQSALQTDDYSATTGTLTFNAGELSQIITIAITESDIIESDEILLINLSGLQSEGRSVSIADSQGQVTILDNDQATVSIDDAIVSESDGTISLTVSLDHAVDNTISIDYTTTDQSADSTSDFQSIAGTLTFNPGETSQSIVIAITDSTQIEADETFLVNLSNLQSNGSNVITANSPAQVTISDDDQGMISITDATVDENAGTATLTVTLTGIVDTTVNVDYATTDQTASAGSDYTSSFGTLSFAPGVETQTIVIPIIDSDLIESDETLLVTLSGIQANGRDVILSKNQGQVTILDDEQVSASISLRVTDRPTDTTDNGESETLPTNIDNVSEWTSYWVELWIDAQNPTGQGVHSAALDLSYQTAYTTATEIQFGPAFTRNQSGQIDDTTGRINQLSAETENSQWGDTRYLLLARIRFESLGDDQVLLDLNGHSIGPHDLELEISSPQVTLEGNAELSTTAGHFPGIEIWANPYDLNDDNRINFRDLLLFASVYNSIPSQSDSDYAWFADLNQNDRVEFKDLLLFASNYNKTREGRDQVNYASSYPEVWNNLLTVESQAEPPLIVEPLKQTTAQSMLDSAVDEVSSQVSSVESQKLESINIQVTDLVGDTLGRAAGNTIYIDSNAAGYGWFIDATPTSHDEFTESSDLTLIALPDSDAAERVDLWSVIMHELGHLLGYDHEESGWMEDSLIPGVRKLPAWENNADQFFSDLSDDMSIIL